MAVCITCGTDSDHTFTVDWDGRSASFDCIECLASMVSPTCRHCGCRILGHALYISGEHFCCTHCAQADDIPVTTRNRWRFGHPSSGAQ